MDRGASLYERFAVATSGDILRIDVPPDTGSRTRRIDTGVRHLTPKELAALSGPVTTYRIDAGKEAPCPRCGRPGGRINGASRRAGASTHYCIHCEVEFNRRGDVFRPTADGRALKIGKGEGGMAAQTDEAGQGTAKEDGGKEARPAKAGRQSWTEERVAEVRRLVEEGASDEEIAEQFGVTEKAVKIIRHRHRILRQERQERPREAAAAPEEKPERRDGGVEVAGVLAVFGEVLLLVDDSGEARRLDEVVRLLLRDIPDSWKGRRIAFRAGPAA